MTTMRDGGGEGPVPGEWAFRILMLLHPASFRERYRAEMLEVFRDTWRREAVGRGAGAALAFWVRTVWGTLGAVAEQRVGGAAAGNGGRDGAGAWSGDAMGGLLHDLRFTARGLRRRPGFAALVVITLTLGMGANTAVFGVLHGVLLAPLPYEDAGRLVRLYYIGEEEPDDLEDVPGMAFIELRERIRSVGFVALYNRVESADLTGGDRPERVRVMRVSSGYFDLLGAVPLTGREFQRGEERDSALVAVVRREIWERHRAGDAGLDGSTAVILDGVTHHVVGVMPDTFRDPLDEDVDVWVPQNLQPAGPNNFDNYYLTVLGRLAPGVTLEQAQQEVAAVSRRFVELDARAEGSRGRLVDLHEDVLGGTAPMLYVVTAAATFLLLIACVNVASLFLVRGASIRGELAIRSALGCGRGRLLRQILLESLTLSVAGGALGLFVGHVLLGGLLALAPPDVPRVAELAVDGPVLVYGAGLAIVAGVLFGLGSAMHYSRTGAARNLTEARKGPGSPSRQRTHQALVVVEVALALVLLVGTGILLRSFHALRTLDLGFEPATVQTFEVHLPDRRYADPAERVRLHRALLERVGTLPGVAHAGAVSRLPATGDWYRWGTGLGDAAGERDVGTFIGANQRVVEGEYFEALGIPLLRGRSFGPEDDATAPHALVVNEALVRRLWPDRSQEEVLGEELWYGLWSGRVIGVVGNVAIGPRGEEAPKVYHSHRQIADNRNWSMVYVLDVERPLPDLATVLRTELATLDPLLVVTGVLPLAEIVGRGVARERFATLLLTLFAGLAVVLAAVGVYGILAYSVARRRREIGVRVALGARTSAVRRLVVGQGLRLALAGVGLGVPIALMLTRWMAPLVYEVSTTDPLVFVSVSAGVVAVAWLASWLPSMRATRLDPSEALRSD